MEAVFWLVSGGLVFAGFWVSGLPGQKHSYIVLLSP